MSSGDVREEGAVRRGRRWLLALFAETLRGGKPACQEADGGGFDIAFAAGDLAGKAQPRHRLEPQRCIEKFWRIEKSIAVQATESGKFRVGERGNGPQDTRLLTVLQ